MSVYPGKALYHLLTNASGVTDIVSTRIYPVTAPQGTAFPFVVYSTISSIPQNTKDVPAAVDHVRLQIDCYAKSTASISGYDQAEQLAAAVRAAIDGVTPGTYAGVLVDGIRFEQENDAIEEEINVFRNSADYQFRIKH